MIQQIPTKFALFLVVLAALAAGAAVLLVQKTAIGPGLSVNFPKINWSKILNPEPSPLVSEIKGMEKFKNEAEFKNYLIEADNLLSGSGYFGGAMTKALSAPEAAIDSGQTQTASGMGGETVERASETNVQVLGIDEPDIVKTNGQEIFFSPNPYYYPVSSGGGIGIMVEKLIAPYQEKASTLVLSAFPPEALAKTGAIDQAGNLLLSKNILIVLGQEKIYGFDVTEPSLPSQKWVFELKNQSYVQEARLFEGKLYLVAKQYLNRYKPCPLEPFTVNGQGVSIACADIYHPLANVSVDITYTALRINPLTGEIEKTTSFVANSNNSLLYMSQNGLFVTYSYVGDFVSFYYDFYSTKASDLVPAEFLDKIKRLKAYDISASSKMAELSVLIKGFYGSLSLDERLRIENEITNRMSDYFVEHKRELEKTGLVKINLDSFDIVAAGDLPGKPLNQFALDEYEGNLRVAVTVGESFSWFFGALSSQSANDVYVLDDKLKIIGEVQDMGLTERVYAVRFVGDKGFVVTFRQTDPFYVLDLSNPKNPQIKGELKIPGYSSYLHPLADNLILGVGKEGQNVKLSLFDVSNPSSPKEKSKYVLQDYWSEVLSTHHAFLADAAHQIFFMPGSQGGYIFSYTNDELKLKRAVSGISAKRALYINDYLYIIGDNVVVVLKESDWTEVKKLEL